MLGEFLVEAGKDLFPWPNKQKTGKEMRKCRSAFQEVVNHSPNAIMKRPEPYQSVVSSNNQNLKLCALIRLTTSN